MMHLDLGIKTTNIDDFKTLELPISHEDTDPTTRFCAKVQRLPDNNTALHITVHGYSGDDNKIKTFEMFEEGISQLLCKFPSVFSQAKEIHISGDWNLPLTVSQAEQNNQSLIETSKQCRKELNDMIMELIVPDSGAIIQTAYAEATVSRARSSRLSLSCQAHKKGGTDPKKDENLSYTCISKQVDPDAKNIIINPIEDVVAKYTIPFAITLNDTDNSLLWDHAACVLKDYQNGKIIGGVLNHLFIGVGPRGLYRGKVTFTPEQMLAFDEQMEQVIKQAVKRFIQHINIPIENLDQAFLQNIAIKVTEENVGLITLAIRMLFDQVFSDPKFQYQRQILIEEGAITSITRKDTFYTISFNDPNPQQDDDCQLNPSEEEIKAAFIHNAINDCNKEININKLITNNLIAAFRLQPFAGFQAEKDIINLLNAPENSLENIATQLSTKQFNQLSELLHLSGYQDSGIDQIIFHIVEASKHRDPALPNQPLYKEPLLIKNCLELDNFIKQTEPQMSRLARFNNTINNIFFSWTSIFNLGSNQKTPIQDEPIEEETTQKQSNNANPSMSEKPYCKIL